MWWAHTPRVATMSTPYKCVKLFLRLCCTSKLFDFPVAVLCCAVLRCLALCCAVPHNVVSLPTHSPVTYLYSTHNPCQPQPLALPANPSIYAALQSNVLCCAVLCCDVLCCAVLCCAVLCCAVLCCAVLCCAVHASQHGQSACPFVCHLPLQHTQPLSPIFVATSSSGIASYTMNLCSSAV